MEISEELIARVSAYKASPATLDPVRNVPLLFMVGISGAGKDALLRQLVATFPDKYQFMLSYTTRAPRFNDGVLEQDGVAYHFIDVATSERMIERGEYLETNYYSNNIYGTGIEDIAQGGRSGKTIVKDVEVNGVDKYMQLGMNLKPVFLIPPSFDAWQERWNKRYGASADPKDVHRRLQTALDELEAGMSHDYFYIVVNDNLEHAVQQVHDIAQGNTKERHDPKAMQTLQELALRVKTSLGEAVTV